MRNRRWLMTLGLLGVAFPVRPAVADAPFFMGLGGLPGTAFRSEALAVSADGRAVVGLSLSGAAAPNQYEAFRWTQETGMVSLGFLPSSRDSQAHGLSADGSVIVGWSGNEAFRWTTTEGMIGLGFLPGYAGTRAHGISGDGSTIVGEVVDPVAGQQAARWTLSGGLVGLGDLPGGADDDSAAAGVSGDGSLVVGAGISSIGREAFRWTQPEGLIGLGSLPGGRPGSAATAVSADGNVIVGTAFPSSGSEAFRWAPETGIIGLGDLPGGVFQSNAFAVSGDGAIVVGWSWTGLGNESFIWDREHGMRNLRTVLASDYGLDLSAWPQLIDARGVSADGRTIVGRGRYEFSPGQFRLEAYIAHIPEPATALMLVSGAAMGARLRHGARRSSVVRNRGGLRDSGRELQQGVCDDAPLSLSSCLRNGPYDERFSRRAGVRTNSPHRRGLQQ